MTTPEPNSYKDAVAELDAILAEIEDANVDVDILAERVGRAAELIEWCRARLIVARTAIDDATAALDDE